jgi:hypothetical protein
VNRFTRAPIAKTLAAALTLALPGKGFACAVCYGQSDSPLAQGMNWGIAVLLCCILSVLCSIVVFFVHVGRNAAKLTASDQPIPNQTDKTP